MRIDKQWVGWLTVLMLSVPSASFAEGAAICRVVRSRADPPTHLRLPLQRKRELPRPLSARQTLVMICSHDAGDQVWRVRSQAACAEQSRCNVWIWDEPSKLPAAKNTAIADSQVEAAVALWINESQTLIRLQTRR